MNKRVKLLIESLFDDYDEIIDNDEEEVVDNALLKEMLYIDLGLPSGVKWCRTNIGAESETDCGDYFAWGETESKEFFTWDNYKYAYDEYKMLKYNDLNDDSYGFKKPDGLKILQSSDDVVTKIYGKGWAMPTSDNYKELIQYTTQEYIDNYKHSGKAGILFKSTLNGKSIFFPLSGYKRGNIVKSKDSYVYMWTSTLCVLMSDNGSYKCDSMARAYGACIRGVYKE